jgi:hypothetical protein
MKKVGPSTSVVFYLPKSKLLPNGRKFAQSGHHDSKLWLLAFEYFVINQNWSE